MNNEVKELYKEIIKDYQKDTKARLTKEVNGCSQDMDLISKLKGELKAIKTLKKHFNNCFPAL